MPQKMFRLTEAEINTIKRIAKERNCTQTDVIRSCISQLEGDIREDIHQDQRESATNEELLAILKNQLEIKDKQISDLSNALTAAQESNKALSANAAIHTAADKKENLVLENSKQKEERKTRWQRLKEAWRG